MCYVKHKNGIRGKILEINMESGLSLVQTPGIINPKVHLHTKHLSVIKDQKEIHQIKLELSGNKLWK